MSKTDKAMSLVNRYGKTALKDLVAERAMLLAKDEHPTHAHQYTKFVLELEWLVKVGISPMPDRLVVTYEDAPCDTLLVQVQTTSEDGRTCVGQRQIEKSRPNALLEGLNDALNRNAMCAQFLAATPYLWDKDCVRAPMGKLPRFALLDVSDLETLLTDTEGVNMAPWQVQPNEDPKTLVDMVRVNRKRRLANEAH